MHSPMQPVERPHWPACRALQAPLQAVPSATRITILLAVPEAPRRLPRRMPGRIRRALTTDVILRTPDNNRRDVAPSRRQTRRRWRLAAACYRVTGWMPTYAANWAARARDHPRHTR